jgi:hypothetical protein
VVKVGVVKVVVVVVVVVAVVVAAAAVVVAIVLEAAVVVVVVVVVVVGIFPNIKRIFHDPKGFNASQPFIWLISIDRTGADVSPQEDRGSPIFCHIHRCGILFPIVSKREKNRGEAEKRLKGRLEHSDSTLKRRVG